MFSVTFNKQLFARVAKLEDAISLALAVHRSSNQTHKIVVDSPDGNEVIFFSFTAKSDA